MYNGHQSQLSTKQIQHGNNQFDEIMQKWINKYNDLLAAGKIQEIELTGKLSVDGLKCQLAVEKYQLELDDEIAMMDELTAEDIDFGEYLDSIDPDANHLKMNGGF